MIEILREFFLAFSIEKASSLAILALACSGLVYLFFEHSENLLSPAAKAKLANELRCLDIRSIVVGAPDNFSELADRIFGTRLFSLRAFFVSAIISVGLLFSIIAALAIYYQLNGIYFNYIEGHWRQKTDELPYLLQFYFLGSNVFVVLVTLTLNIFVDYLSLTFTRLVIGLLRKRRSVFLVLVFLLLDFFASYVIFVVPTFEILHLLFDGTYFVSLQWNDFPFVVNIEPRLAIINGLDTIAIVTDWYRLSIAASMFTSLLSSVWLWIFVAATALAWLLRMVTPGIEFLKWALDIEAHPLRALAPFAAIATFVVFYTVLYAYQIGLWYAALPSHGPYVHGLSSDYPNLRGMAPVASSTIDKVALVGTADFPVVLLEAFAALLLVMLSLTRYLRQLPAYHGKAVVRVLLVYFAGILTITTGGVLETVLVMLFNLGPSSPGMWTPQNLPQFMESARETGNIVGFLGMAALPGAVSAYVSLRTMTQPNHFRATALAAIITLTAVDSIHFFVRDVSFSHYMLSILSNATGGWIVGIIVVATTRFTGLCARPARSSAKVRPPGKHVPRRRRRNQ